MRDTTQVLGEVFGQDEAYINRFISIAVQTDLNLDALLNGGVDTKAAYTLEEKKQIVATLQTLVKQQFNQAYSVLQPTYTATAGASGCGKTFALEQRFDIDVANNKFAKNTIYIGPDSVVLPQMPAYLSDCVSIGHAAAYAKWRDASNYIANFMFAKAITDKLNIVHDTTATHPRMVKILATLKEQGYNRHMHFYIADKDARAQAVMHRKQAVGHTMVTLSDTVSKAEAAYRILAEHKFKELVDLMFIYAQRDRYWLGTGSTIAIAVYDPSKGTNIQVLSDGQEQIDHILKQMDEKENFEPELRSAVHAAISAWSKWPDASYKSPPLFKM